MRRLIFLLLAATSSITSRGFAQQDIRTFYADEVRKVNEALRDPSTQMRVLSIWSRLTQYSGRMFPVLPAQQFIKGQALPNGVVLLDLSAAHEDNVEVTAFWLAHEYGHQVLGHPQLVLTDWGRFQMALSSQTANEDAADRWAARFLRAGGFEIGPVLDALCDLPESPRGDSHSDGRTRAQNVARAYGVYETDPCRGTHDLPEYAVSIQIWSPYSGNVMSMDVAIDDQEVGSLANVDDDRTLDLGQLRAGEHTFTLSNITVYGPYGQAAAGGFYCAGTLRVAGERMYRLSLRIAPNGAVACRFD